MLEWGSADGTSNCESVTVITVVASVTMARRPDGAVLRPYSCSEGPRHVDHAT